MKKIILTALVAVASLAANAQVFLGGSVGLGLNKPCDGADTKGYINITPTIGYNFNDQWAVVVDFSENYNAASEANIFGLGVAARWSFAKAGAATFFLDGGFNYSTENKKGGLNGNNYLEVGFTPGVKFAVTKHIDVITTLGFVGYNATLNNSKGSNFGIDAKASNLTIGMLYNF